MRNRVTKPNGTKVRDKSFKYILNEMMKLTNGGSIKAANKHWDIFAKPINNSSYYNYAGA